jgi:predicted enzyme related to lactoylglutathione lyase
MTNPLGSFVWYELMTSDTSAAKTFYGKVAGWGTQDIPMPGMTYTLFSIGETPVGGLMDLPADAANMGIPPNWISYVGVADVDAATEQAKRLGGSMFVPPRDIPNVGRFAVIADPQGAAISLFKWLTPRPDPTVAPGTPGHVGWHELAAADWEKAFAFYSALFGWQKADAVDMGPTGTYQLFSVAGGPAVGGMYNKPAAMPRPFWLYYINVAAVDAAVERVSAGGGKILNGPMQVPGGSWIVQCADPQGAMFALVGGRR